MAQFLTTTDACTCPCSALAQAQREAARVKEDELIAMREKELVEIAAKQEEDRRELIMNQSIRRLKHRDLTAGFSAWVELWEAKTYALQKLREVGERPQPKLQKAPPHIYTYCVAPVTHIRPRSNLAQPTG